MNSPLAMWEPKRAALLEADARLAAADRVIIWRDGTTYYVAGGILPMAVYTQRTDNESDIQPERSE